MQIHHQRMQTRARIAKAIRAFFDERDFLEVDTPIALTAPAPEPTIEAPTVYFRDGHGQCHQRFLQPSPELPMKRLLAMGFANIFQIAPVFRDGEVSPTHRPEFRMLEWYRSHTDWHILRHDCMALLQHVARAAGHTSLQWTYQGRNIDLTQPCDQMTVDDAFRAHAGFSILDALDHATLRKQLSQLQIHFHPDDSWDDLFHRIFLTRVEPALMQRQGPPLLLTHYPAPLAALARKCPDDPRVAERFEMYLGGLELANGYGELTCPHEQRQRFLQDQSIRQARGMHHYPLDERFLHALESFPPTAGIALGVDRLLMILLDVPDIEATAFIPWSAS